MAELIRETLFCIATLCLWGAGALALAQWFFRKK
jgi:hypothetical protein